MRVGFGLGNPGPRYEKTRHNFGFLVLDALARSRGAGMREGPGPYHLGEISVGQNRGILAKPMTYMNRSGIAARVLRDRFSEIHLSRFLVVSDDLDLPLGRMRLRAGGSAGGQKGLRSIIEELGTEDFPRLRLGIGRPPAAGPDAVIEHVLAPFAEDEKEVAEEIVARAVEGIEVFLGDGLDRAMSCCNAA